MNKKLFYAEFCFLLEEGVYGRLYELENALSKYFAQYSIEAEKVNSDKGKNIFLLKPMELAPVPKESKTRSNPKNQSISAQLKRVQALAPKPKK